MKPSNVRSYFENLAAIGRQPRLRDAVGTCEFDIAGAGIWCVEIDHGDVRVVEGPAKTEPLGRVRADEASFLRVARGDDQETFVTAVIRGAVSVEGEFTFLQKLRVLAPLA